MRPHTFELVRQLQARIEAKARATFDEKDLDALRTLIRLTVEFADYLDAPPSIHGARFDTEYVAESTFAGVESFTWIAQHHRCLAEAPPSQVGMRDVGAIEEKFRALYPEFLREVYFERQCRLLLDLFKLQIAFSGLVYP